MKPVFFINAGMSGSLAPESFDEAWGSGGTYGIEAGYKLTPVMTAGIFLDINKFKLLDDKLIKEAGLEGLGLGLMGGDAKIISYGLNIRVYAGARKKEARPYLMLGLGWVRLTGSDLYLTYMGQNVKVGDWAGNETAGMIAAGFGLEIYLSASFSLFADFKYSIANTDVEKTKFLPIRLGLALY